MTYQCSISTIKLPPNVKQLRDKGRGLIRYEISGFSFDLSTSELNQRFRRGDKYGPPFYTSVILNKFRREMKEKYGLDENLRAALIKKQLPRYNPNSNFNPSPTNLRFLAIHPYSKILQVRLYSDRFQFDKSLEERIISELALFRDNESQPKLPLLGI